MLLNGLGHLCAEDAVPGLGVARLARSFIGRVFQFAPGGIVMWT